MLALILPGHAAPTYKGPALETLSASVQKTVKDQLGGGAIVSIEREVEDGDIYYTIEMLKDGKARSVAVNEDGSLSSVQRCRLWRIIVSSTVLRAPP